MPPSAPWYGGQARPRTHAARRAPSAVLSTPPRESGEPPASGKRPAADVIDVAPVRSEDEIFVEQTGTAMQGFLRSLAGFFLTAREIEQGAQRTLATARTLVQPTNQVEDDRMIAFVRSTTIERKVAEDHWQIAQVVHRFHKRLTAARDRATGPLEEAG